MSGPGESNEEELTLRERPVPEISETLQRILGEMLVAYAISEKNPKRIGDYARAEDSPTEETEAVLRDLAEVTEVLLEKERGSEESVRAIMLGVNPVLNDKTVVELFHNGQASTALLSAKYL